MLLNLSRRSNTVFRHPTCAAVASCELFGTDAFPRLSASILVDYMDLVSSAHRDSRCFSQDVLAGGEVGEGYKPGAAKEKVFTLFFFF